MIKRAKLVESLTALESDLNRYSVSSGAIVPVRGENASDGVIALFTAVKDLGHQIPVEINDFDLMRVAGSDFKVERNRLTERCCILARSGRYELPPGTRLTVVGKF